MPRSISIGVAQPETVTGDVAGNVANHVDALDRAAVDGARVVLFPELSLTGYAFDAEPLTPHDERLDPLVAACARAGLTALVGAPVTADGGGRHIAVLAVDGGGARVAYRKQWLGRAERPHFIAGPAPAAVAVDGVRFGLAVCRDTGIPDHAAATAAIGIDVYAAGVLEHAADAHVTPERARRVATAHGVWVAVAGFAGGTGEGYAAAAGGSGLWRSDGSTLAVAGAEVGEIVVGRVDLDS